MTEAPRCLSRIFQYVYITVDQSPDAEVNRCFTILTPSSRPIGDTSCRDAVKPPGRSFFAVFVLVGLWRGCARDRPRVVDLVVVLEGQLFSLYAISVTN